jgi:HPt (histidine-containing phosphotransfer) domain-containing protein
MTAHAMKGDRERCLAAGMDDYVGKPVRAQDLFDAIARVLPPGSVSIATPPLPQTDELDVAELLDRVGGDRALLGDLVRLFLETYPENLAGLRQAVASGDSEAVHRLAHTFKGMVGHFGAPAAVEAALRLEVMGRTKDLSGAEEACAALTEAVERLRTELVRKTEGGSL